MSQQYAHEQRLICEVFLALIVIALIARKQLKSAVGTLTGLAYARYPKATDFIMTLLVPPRRYAIYADGRVVPIRTHPHPPARSDEDDEQQDDRPSDINPDNWEIKQLEGWQHSTNVLWPLNLCFEDDVPGEVIVAHLKFILGDNNVALGAPFNNDIDYPDWGIADDEVGVYVRLLGLDDLVPGDGMLVTA